MRFWMGAMCSPYAIICAITTRRLGGINNAFGKCNYHKQNYQHLSDVPVLRRAVCGGAGDWSQVNKKHRNRFRRFPLILKWWWRGMAKTNHRKHGGRVKQIVDKEL